MSTSILPERAALLPKIIVRSGSHTPPSDPSQPEGCVMELASWLRGQPWGDNQVPCVAHTIRSFLIRLNDRITDDTTRTKLLLPLLLDGVIFNTATTPEDEQKRAWLAADFAVRYAVPVWFDLAPALSDAAEALRALSPLVNAASYHQARPVVQKAMSDAAYAAYAAAYAADACADAAAYAAGKGAQEHLLEDAVDLVRRMCAVGRSAA